MKRLATLPLALLLLSPALADDTIPLTGSVYLGDNGCSGGIKSKDCIMTFEVSGKAAKLLFEGMRVKAVKEECTGGMQKVDGNGLNCIKSDDKTYHCDFGYTFSKKAFTGSAVDC
jgi:hypothetical protein